eukprot:scaffold2229_cov413-Prasinococcus_capsulatus_cf.AAC.5
MRVPSADSMNTLSVFLKPQSDGCHTYSQFDPLAPDWVASAFDQPGKKDSQTLDKDVAIPRL